MTWIFNLKLALWTFEIFSFAYKITEAVKWLYCQLTEGLLPQKAKSVLAAISSIVYALLQKKYFIMSKIAAPDLHIIALSCSSNAEGKHAQYIPNKIELNSLHIYSRQSREEQFRKLAHLGVEVCTKCMSFYC